MLEKNYLSRWSEDTISYFTESTWAALLKGSLFIFLCLYFFSSETLKLVGIGSPVVILPFVITLAANRWDLFFSPFKTGIVLSVLAIQIFLFSLNIYHEYYSLNYNFFDTGFFWNPIANFSQGHGFYNSELQLSEFADHFCPALLLFFAPLFSAVPDAVLLPVAKVGFIVLSFYLLYRLLCYYGLESEKRNFLLLFWAINIGFVNFMGFEFQSSNLIVPFVFLLFQLFDARKYLWFSLVSLLVICLKENGSLVIIAIGVFSVVYLDRLKPGLILIVVGTILLWSLPKIVMPFLSGVTGANDSAFDPFCCIPEKINFILLVFMCSGFALLFHPRSLLVLIPAMAGSLLIGRSGAHTLTFHYQDIPLAVSYSLLGFLMSKNKGIWPAPVLELPDFRVLAAFLFGIAFYQNQYSGNYFVQANTPTDQTFSAIEAMDKFRKDYNGTSRIWAQTCLAFYMSSENKIKCIMDANQTIMDAEANYVVLCDAAPGRWPIDADYERLKTLMREDVQKGVRVEHLGYPPLIIFERK
jgi:uncharacterized membrane protein